MRNLIFIVFLFNSFGLIAQNKQELASQKSLEAVRFLDEKKYDSALVLYKQACTLDPNNNEYPYEVAYCHYNKGNHKAAIEVLEKLVKKDTNNDQIYQLLGNSYDNEFNHDKAISVYKKGLEKFPKSGPLYVELGTVYLAKKELNTALNYFEKGIEVEPTFIANYFQTSKLFCASDNKLWGILYGELLMNLDRSSDKAQEISKLLYSTYQQGFTFKNNAFAQLQFNKNGTFASKKQEEKKVYPEQYLRLVVEPTLKEAAANTTQISIQELTAIRKKFAEIYQEKYSKDYPNILYAYHAAIIKADMWDSYNYWLFNKGNTAEFRTWIEANRPAFKKFLTWFKNNPLEVSNKNYLHRVNYK